LGIEQVLSCVDVYQEKMYNTARAKFVGVILGVSSWHIASI